MLAAYDLGALRAELYGVAEDQSDCWKLWEQKGELRVDKKTVANPGSTLMGRAHLTFDYDGSFAHLASFLYQADSKPLYDEFAEPMQLLLEEPHSEDDRADFSESQPVIEARVVHQVYRGRFGFSGRSFLMAVSRELSAAADQGGTVEKGADTLPPERLVIALRSVAEGADEALVDALIVENASPDTQAAYASSRTKTVRGYVHLAGFVVKRPRGSKRVSLTWVFDADIKTQGVPNWVVTRVKIDQLKIVRAIPGALAAWEPKQTGDKSAAEDGGIVRAASPSTS